MGLFLAWAVGEGIIFYRWGKLGAPPTPGVLALSSALYAGLAVAAEIPNAKTVVTAFAWAVDVAILMQVLGKAPTGTTGWPPPLIDDATVIMPPGASASSSSSAAAPAASAPAASVPTVAPNQLAG
jgi:hypothetical protein